MPMSSRPSSDTTKEDSVNSKPVNTYTRPGTIAATRRGAKVCPVAASSETGVISVAGRFQSLYRSFAGTRPPSRVPPLASASFPRWSTSRNQPAWDTLGAFVKAPSELGLGYFAQTEETGELRVNHAGNPVDLATGHLLGPVEHRDCVVPMRRSSVRHRAVFASAPQETCPTENEGGFRGLGIFKATTVHEEFRVLRRALNVAVRKKFLSANPCAGVEFPVGAANDRVPCARTFVPRGQDRHGNLIARAQRTRANEKGSSGPGNCYRGLDS